MREIALVAAAVIVAVVGVAHSWLGERYLLRRLFRRPDLPRLFGGTRFTVDTLRFAWHLTTVAWWGLAAILVLMAQEALTARAAGLVVAVTLLVHAAVAVAGSRGRHLAWIAFLVAGLLVLFAIRA